MPFQATPGRRGSSQSPVIIDTAEMFESPRPEARLGVSRLHEASHVLLRDSHSTVDALLRRMIMGSRRANSDTLGMA
eukprot:3022136-Rhodomonas_salina.1